MRVDLLLWLLSAEGSGLSLESITTWRVVGEKETPGNLTNVIKQKHFPGHLCLVAKLSTLPDIALDRFAIS